MSILKSLQNYISDYGKIEFRRVQVTETEDGLAYRDVEAMTDLVGEHPGSYALSPTGNSLTKQDILGNRTYQNSYVFYAKEHVQNEIDRQETHDFLESFADWLEYRSTGHDLPELKEPLEPMSLEMSNGMLLDVYEDGTGLYQIQIQFVYKKLINL